MNYILANFAQAFFVVALTPLFSGILSNLKANLRGYSGPSIFQIYYEYIKLFSRSRIRSKHSSFITSIGPVLALSATITVAFMVPVLFTNSQAHLGNMFIIVFMLGYVKFFNTLIGLECSSTFGGMGSSRELFLSMLAEPVMFAIITFLYLENGTFNVFKISALNAVKSPFEVGNILALIAFFIILIVENTRLPVDNPETHLELTMIHEAMILDLSGRDLLFIEVASNLKFVLFITLFVNIFFPVGLAVIPSFVTLLWSSLFYFLKVTIVLSAIALIEIMMAKSRLFRSPELIAAAFSIVIAAIALGHLS